MIGARVNNGKPRAQKVSKLCAIAKALGVSRSHLLAVIKGRRVSASLSARYAEYLAAHPMK